MKELLKYFSGASSEHNLLNSESNSILRNKNAQNAQNGHLLLKSKFDIKIKIHIDELFLLNICNEYEKYRIRQSNPYDEP